MSTQLVTILYHEINTYISYVHLAHLTHAYVYLYYAKFKAKYLLWKLEFVIRNKFHSLAYLKLTYTFFLSRVTRPVKEQKGQIP